MREIVQKSVCSFAHLKKKHRPKASFFSFGETSLTPRRATMFSDAWRASSRGFASAAKPLRKGAHPPASQPLVLLGVCVGLALAAAPLAFKSVRQREQSVAEMRDAQYAGDGKDAARDDRLKGRPNKSR